MDSMDSMVHGKIINNIKDIDFTENDITIDDIDYSHYANIGDLDPTVYKQLWSSNVKRRIKDFDKKLSAIAKKEMNRNLDRIEALDINVSKLYFNTTLKENEGQGLVNGKPKYSIITGDDYTNNILFGWDIHIGCDLIHSFTVEIGLTRYDTCTSGEFPIVYVLDSSLLELGSVNTKMMTVDSSPRLFLIDIDADKRQEVTIITLEKEVRNLKYIKEDKVELHKTNKKEFEERFSDDIKDSICDLPEDYYNDYIMYRSDTGKYTTELTASWEDILALDYLHRYGDILQEDLTSSNKKELYKYGWFAVCNLNSGRFNSDYILEYNINLYRYILYKLKKSKVKLSKTKWKLVDKECIVINDFTLDMYAKLENGHRIIAFDFVSNIPDEVEILRKEESTVINMELDNIITGREWHENNKEFINYIKALLSKHKCGIQEKYGDTLTLLNKYTNSDFGMSIRRFEESQKNVLNRMVDNHIIKLFDNEQDMLDDLDIIDSHIEYESVIKIGFYSQKYNKFISICLTQYESAYWRLELAYPFLKFNYPLRTGILSLDMGEDTLEEKMETIRYLRSLKNGGGSDATQIGNIVIYGLYYSLDKIIILDNIEHNVNIRAVNRKKSINLNERIKLFNMTAKFSDNYDKNGILKSKLCRYNSNTDLYLTRYKDFTTLSQKTAGMLRIYAGKPSDCTSIDLVRIENGD